MISKWFTYFRWLLVLVFLGILAGCSYPNGGGGDEGCNKRSGTTVLGLQQESPGSFHYNTTATNPLAMCAGKQTIIMKVTNISGFNYTLAHGSPYIILNNGQSTTALNNLPVEGNWSAQFSGSANNLPQGVAVQVDWAAR